ncbi:MAG TPA: hypothetical protein VMM12_11080 [Longimicrobiales bacterium]|nr:hypothetical protein [Longimicrobiales bacterium]
MKRVLTSVLALGLLASPAAAQGDLLSACGSMTVTFTPFTPSSAERDNAEQQLRFLCGQVVAALTNVQPTIGIGFTGGNPVLGTATTIGRRLGLFPRISVTARGNLALADVPDLLNGFDATIGSSGQLPPMETNMVPFGALQGDVALGLFNGMSAGPLGGFGAIDLLGSISMIPAVEQTGMADPIINWGAGARIGILKQGLVLPGISVSGMYRNMAEVSFGDLDAGDPAEFSTDLSILSLRAGISKGILALDFAAGAGYDMYSSDVGFDFVLTCPPNECLPAVEARVEPTERIEGELKTAAWNVFGNVGLSLLVVNVVGELGYQKATEVVTAADFRDAGLPDQQPTAGDLSGGRLFGSVGVRFTF